MNIWNVRQDRGTEWQEERGNGEAPAMLVAVSYGRVNYEVNGTDILLEKGDWLLISSGVSYRARSYPSVFHEKYVVTFEGSEQISNLPIMAAGSWTHTRVAMYEWMMERLRTLHEEWTDQAPYASLRCPAILQELLSLWSREHMRGPLPSSANELAERMKAYVAGHYRGRVTKEELGDAVERTPNHAAALFKRATGQTISEYVHAARMKTAVYLLKDSLLTVGEIADYLGYRDVSYFQRIFKRSTGHSPSVFMRDRPIL
ncbi:hypothetical protein AXX17_ATUG04860 [Arabidopsis thaliana]|uniref:HTH araC/xylS-type domain-containing protein n=1 Tax=Arabidopsis thaliana TaxID=3702 RepID=A0A178U555_ARATH|nr:hypothetical protein AXX17_ATUG04860 [Arabidopsis thaliana]